MSASVTEQMKSVGDAVAIPTGLYVGIGTLLGYIQTFVGIVAGALAAAYTAYRIYDLYEQRKQRKP